MSDTIERRVTVYRDSSGHKPVTATVTESTSGHMPIMLSTGPNVVHLTWSDWDEVRDHIEYCAQMMRPEDDTYVPCNAMPGLVPYDALPCILEQGHGEVGGDPKEPIGTGRHFDRRGRSW